MKGGGGAIRLKSLRSGADLEVKRSQAPGCELHLA